MMIRYSKALIITSLLVLSQWCVAQSERDSLLSIRLKADNQALPGLMAELANTYRKEDIGIMKVYLDSAFSITDKDTPASQKMLVHRYYADYHNKKAQTDSAIYFYKIAEKNAELALDDIGKARIISKIGLMYYKKGRYEQSSEYIIRAVKLAEETGHKPTISACYEYLGHLNYVQKKFREAIKYQLMGKEISMEEHNLRSAASSDVNIGNAYHQLKLLDSSLFYLQSALDYFVTNKDTLAQSYPLNNMAIVYFDQKKYKQSIDYLEKGLAIRRKYNEPRGISFGLNYIAENYRGLGQFEKAIDYYEKSIEQSILIDYLLLMENSYQGLAESHAQLKQFEKAYEYQKKLKTTSDTLFNRDKFQSLADAQTKYETEKKEQLILIQKSQIGEQQVRNQLSVTVIIGLGLLVLFLVLFVILVKSRSRKQKELMLQTAKVQLRDAQIEASISSQEKERSRFAKDLHDGFGQMISILSLNLKSIETDPTSRQTVFDESAKVLQEMYGELKRICFNLMPQALIGSGIAAAINEFSNRINISEKVIVETNFFGLEERLTELQEISLYRISQEWVNNILKYSDATKVGVQITKDMHELTLIIEDNGSGFDLDKLTNGNGNGWKNMNARAALIKGELEVDTLVGRRGNSLILNAVLERPHNRKAEIELPN